MALPTQQDNTANIQLCGNNPLRLVRLVWCDNRPHSATGRALGKVIKYLKQTYPEMAEAGFDHK